MKQACLYIDQGRYINQLIKEDITCIIEFIRRDGSQTGEKVQ